MLGCIKKSIFNFRQASNRLVFHKKSFLEKMKLPGGSRTFFEEMIEKDEDCICGDKLTEHKIDHIRKSIENYLGNNEI